MDKLTLDNNNEEKVNEFLKDSMSVGVTVVTVGIYENDKVVEYGAKCIRQIDNDILELKLKVMPLPYIRWDRSS